jgi:phosphoserine phosphatase
MLFVPGDGGPVERWSADTVPLGLVEPLPCDGPRRIPMAPGDQLVLLTDGFFEWTNPGRELFGLDRLVDSIARHRGLEPAEQIRALHEDVLAFAEGTPQSDDLTAVVIRRD